MSLLELNRTLSQEREAERNKPWFLVRQSLYFQMFVDHQSVDSFSRLHRDNL